MLSVLIETRNDEEELARTLGSLVPAAIEGIVREVMVIDRGSTDQTLAVADHAGCTLVADGDLAAAVRRARAEWLLLVEPGARLLDGWVEPVLLHATKFTTPARFSRSRSSSRFLARFLPRSRPLAEGFLVSKPQALARVKSGEGVEAMLRGLSSRRLAAEIAPAGRRR